MKSEVKQIVFLSIKSACKGVAKFIFLISNVLPCGAASSRVHQAAPYHLKPFQTTDLLRKTYNSMNFHPEISAAASHLNTGDKVYRLPGVRNGTRT